MCSQSVADNAAVMIKITLPDGSVREVPRGTTALDLAGQIGNRLKKDALVAEVNGRLHDLNDPLTEDASVAIITWNDPKGQEVYRHTTAHVLAQAVKRLFPQAKISIGPPIENGFYYDIDFPRAITPDDLPVIEAEMEKCIRENHTVTHRVVGRDEAIEFFSAQNEPFKVELIQDMPPDAVITFYEQGDFTDLCRGPHVPSTGYIKSFKLLSLAGSYWRGDEKRPMLTRVYGTAFPDKKDLKEYLHMLEEAKKRDHRRIGRELDLFSFQDEGPGFPFFHGKGMVVYNKLMEYCREELARLNYEEIKTPTILNESLWHRSGHWDNYKENMYFTEIDEGAYAVKPMNCPGGLLVYKSSLHSYRDLPLKVAEFGQVHRHERSGVLHGLFRVRCFTQDDAHIFCAPDQLEDPIVETIELIQRIYHTFGFDNVEMELSTRPEKSIGSDEVWEQATAALRQALERKQIKYKLNPGDGAFYGPKIDFHVKDCIGRKWQCATIQCDFSMPERFDLHFVNRDGERKRPVMIHRAVFGSLERFIGILIEHFEGNFPLWLAPVQAAVIPISAEVGDYARKVRDDLAAAGLRVTLDSSDETLGKKVRNAEKEKIPVMLVIGAKEAEAGTVAVRRHKKGQTGVLPLAEAIAALKDEERTRAIVD